MDGGKERKKVLEIVIPIGDSLYLREGYLKMKKGLRKKRIVLLSVVILVISVFIIIRHLIITPLIHVEYNGEITKYNFDMKGYGNFQIDNNDQWYEMHYLECDLKLGDSMVKKMDDGYIYHFRDGELIGVYGAIFGRRYKW